MKISKNVYKITIPTMFTLLRILITPIIVYLMVYGHWYGATICFTVAALTDFIDGFLARYLNQKTFLGACLDPVADKILLFCSFFTLWYVAIDTMYVPTWFICLLLTKELMQIVGALILYTCRGLTAIEANMLGKITTVAQIMFVILLLQGMIAGVMYETWIYHYFLIGISSLMIVSFIQYSAIWGERLTTGSNR